MILGPLHQALLQGVLATGACPTQAELRATLGCSAAELARALDELAQAHGVVLHPGRHEVWAIHPFSLAPTPFLVECGERRWWGNCAWCSLGIAVLAGAPCCITTTLGAETERVELEVRHGSSGGMEVAPSDLVVHFPIPMTRAWDNVVYTCSTMLLFRDATEVERWCARHRIPRGDVQPVTKVLELARRWYGAHLRPDWRKWSLAEARALFAELGLRHPVWDLPAEDGRF